MQNRYNELSPVARHNIDTLVNETASRPGARKLFFNFEDIEHCRDVVSSLAIDQFDSQEAYSTVIDQIFDALKIQMQGDD